MAKRYEFDDALKGIYTDHDEVAREQITDYRAVEFLSIGAVICGLLSSLTFLSWSLLAVPLIGTILALIALRKILNAAEEVGGIGLTAAGLGLSLLFGGAGFGVLTYHHFNSVPAGYHRVDFDDLSLDSQGHTAEMLEGLVTQQLPVFIQGYMYQTNRMSGIDHFMLVKSTEHCKSCAPTKNPTEMIEVVMTGGQKVAYRTRPVRVGGVLEFDLARLRQGQSPYTIRADVFR